MKLSIITINYNNADGLRKTMESVFSQTYRNFEYIVVDGASTDDSVEVIRASALQADGMDFKWVSEADTGIYNAMNKGIEIAEGRRVINPFNRSELVKEKKKCNEEGYVLMLNSGDFFVDKNVVERIIPELHSEDIIQGNVIEDYPSNFIRYRGYGRSNISFIDAMNANFPHQATFIKLSTMEKYGYYDASYKKAADSYFFMTALGLGNATFRYIDVDVTNFDVNGISSMKDPKWKQIDKEEDERWYREHLSRRLRDLYYDAPHKLALYDTLHAHKWMWKIVMGLIWISNKLYIKESYIKKEKIK